MLVQPSDLVYPCSPCDGYVTPCACWLCIFRKRRAAPSRASKRLPSQWPYVDLRPMSNGRYLFRLRSVTLLPFEMRKRQSRDALVFAHVLDLSAEGDEGEDAKVHDEDRPEDRHVEHGNKSGDEAQRDRLGGAVPVAWEYRRKERRRNVGQPGEGRTGGWTAGSEIDEDVGQGEEKQSSTDQNLNSGRRRIKGRNSPSWTSLLLVGSVGAPSSASVSARSASSAGSNLGVMKARNRFRR